MADPSTQKLDTVVAKSKIVYELLIKEARYVSNLYTDKATILLSGFGVGKDPVQYGIPSKLVIKKIKDGTDPNTAKALINKIPEGEKVDRYKVETSVDARTWTLKLEIGSSQKLIFTTVRGVEVSVRVTGGNTHGYGKSSDPIPFLPR